MNEIVKGEVVEAGAIARRGDAAVYAPIVARVGVSIRPGTMDDIAFIDRMQKANGRALGFLPTKAIEGKVKLGHVLVAEVRDQKSEVSDGSPSLTSDLRSLTSVPVGYLIAQTVTRSGMRSGT